MSDAQQRPSRRQALRYPADPPAVEEIVAVMRVAGNTTHGLRARALMVMLWRASLRISDALALAESDLDRSRGSVLVRCGKGGKRRRAGMDRWACETVGARTRADAPGERWPALTVVARRTAAGAVSA